VIELWITLVIVAPIVAIATVILVAKHSMRNRRGRELERVARSMGWEFQKRAQHLEGRWRGQPFNVGHSRRVSFVLSGQYEGRSAAVFEYTYTTGFGQGQSTTLLTVAVMSLPAPLPDLELTHEGLGAKLAKSLGAQDIQFESEEFNRRWRVEAAVPRAAHDIVHPRFMEFMVASPPEPLRFEGVDVLTWHLGPLDPRGIHPRLARLARAVDLVPRHVWQDYGYDPHAGAGGAPGLKG